MAAPESSNPYQNPDIATWMGSFEGVPDAVWPAPLESSAEEAARGSWQNILHQRFDALAIIIGRLSIGSRGDSVVRIGGSEEDVERRVERRGMVHVLHQGGAQGRLHRLPVGEVGMTQRLRSVERLHHGDGNADGAELCNEVGQCREHITQSARRSDRAPARPCRCRPGI